ncbi:MAG: family 43 glycosylhydrolase [Anaerolineae bacterium]|jgi:arabinoxylan arabinofuranohydrolase|nr:family 43 glycosylhydrolase [Chloroflexota bacterium]
MTIYTDCRNPVLPPSLHIPDVEARVMPDGRLYVYGSWDQFDDTYCSRQYRVFSTDNMRDWTDHGVSFDADQVPWMNDPAAPRYPHGEDLETTARMAAIRAERARRGRADAAAHGLQAERRPELPMLYAPDCIHRDGRYWLYFCGSDHSEGVAVADRPEGPFGEATRIPVGGIDPAILIDDDGQAWYTWGGGFLGRGARMQRDMRTLVPGSEVPRLADDASLGYYEASSLRKIGQTYYMVYCCVLRGKPTALAWATASRPLGPYRHGGIILDNDGCDPGTWNNHGSIACLHGQWYLFYHRASRNGFRRRRLCVEPIQIAEDGSIAEVPMTSQGAGRPFGLGETIEGWRACGVSGGAWVGPDGQGREALLGLVDGAGAVFRYVDWREGPRSLEVEAQGNGELTLWLEGEEAPAGRALIRAGRCVESGVAAAAGMHGLRLQVERARGLVLYGLRLS